MNHLTLIRTRIGFMIAVAGSLVGSAFFVTEPTHAAAAPTATPSPTFPTLSQTVYNLDHEMYAANFSTEGPLVIYDDRNGISTIFSLSKHKPIQQFNHGRNNDNYEVKLSPDGKEILFVDQNNVQIWDIRTGNHIGTYNGFGYDSHVHDAAMSPDGKTVVLAAGSEDDDAVLYQVSNGKRLQIFRHNVSSKPTGEGISVAFSPDGKQIVAGGSEGVSWLWDVASGNWIQTYIIPTDSVKSLIPLAVNSVAFSPDGNDILTGSYDGTARLWDAGSGQTIHTFSGQNGVVISATFSPNGRYILTSSTDRIVQLWDTSTGQVLQRFMSLTDYAPDAAFSPDGHYVLLADDSRVVRLLAVNPSSNGDLEPLITTLPAVDDLSRPLSLNDNELFGTVNIPETQHIEVNVSPSESRLWTNGLCVDSLSDLQADWKLIKQHFLINGVEIASNQLLEHWFFVNSISKYCIEQATLLSGWKSGEIYTLATEQIFSDGVLDANKIFSPGDYNDVILITVQ